MKPSRSASSFINLVGAMLFVGGFSLWAYGIWLACQFLNLSWWACLYGLVAVGVISASIVFGNRRKKAGRPVSVERTVVLELEDEAGAGEANQAVLRHLHSSPPFHLPR